jgi:O-acetyl-ADP-ribose deacetylase
MNTSSIVLIGVLAILGLVPVSIFYFFNKTKTTNIASAAHSAYKKDLFLIGNTRVHIVDGDITAMKVQAIVNAANKALPWPAGGVAGVIYTAADSDQLNAWVEKNVPVNENGNRIELGDAVVSPSFNLAKNGIQYIIHAVGPDARIGEPVSALHDTYKNSLLKAAALNVTSIAFPAISIGIFACDKKEAAFHMAQALVSTLPGISIADVYLVIQDPKYRQLSQVALQQATAKFDKV